MELTDDAERAAARIADHIEGASAADLLAAPFVLIGTVEEIVAELRRHHDEMGVNHYVVRAAAMDAVAPIISALS